MNEQEAVEKLRESTETEQGLLSEEEPKEQPEESKQEPEEETENIEEPSEEPDGQESDSEEADDGAETVELEADQFAELLNLKDDQLIVEDDGVKFRARVGDKYEDVSLDQLINAYQGDANLTNRSKEVAKLEKQRQSELQSFVQQKQQFAEQAASVLEGIKNEFIPQYSKSELEQLKEDDPAQYAAVLAERRQKEEAFNRLVNNAINTASQADNYQDEETQKLQHEYLMEQAQRVKKNIPDFDKVKTELADYLRSSDFDDSEINSIVDARAVEMAYKAMMFDKGKASAQKKLVKKVPKVVKPGAKAPKNDMNIELAKKHRSRLKETGSMQDAAALLKQLRS